MRSSPQCPSNESSCIAVSVKTEGYVGMSSRYWERRRRRLPFAALAVVALILILTATYGSAWYRAGMVLAVLALLGIGFWPREKRSRRPHRDEGATD